MTPAFSIDVFPIDRFTDLSIVDKSYKYVALVNQFISKNHADIPKDFQDYVAGNAPPEGQSATYKKIDQLIKMLQPAPQYEGGVDCKEGRKVFQLIPEETYLN